MLKNKKKPRKPIQIRDSKKGNDRAANGNIFQLIGEIPKEEKTASEFDSHYLDLKFCECLLQFCEKALPEKLEELEFTKDQTLGNLIYGLMNLIIDNNFTIHYNPSGFAEKNIVDFLFANFKYEWHWYILEAKNLHKINSEELKIGFCYLMKKMGLATDETNFIKHDYSDFNNSLFEYEKDYIESMFEEGEIDSDVETFEEWETEQLKPYLETKKEYDELIIKPIDVFHQYKPKNKPETELKKLIETGLKLDFEMIHRFPDNEETYTEDGNLVSYSQSFMLIHDWESNLEEIMMERWNMDANHNGVTYPTNYYRYIDKKIKDPIPEEDQNALLSICELLTNISDYFN